LAQDVSFAALLRRLRVTADLTLEQLAERSGVSDRAISDMERGVSRGPRVRTVEALADGLSLAADERAALLAAARAGRSGVTPAPASGLPPPRRVSDFTGRDAELAQVTGWVDGSAAGTPSPVVVVSGPPGVGKTSLAVQAAQAWDADQQLFVDLRGLDARPLTPAAVLARLIRAVSPQTGVLPRDLDEAAALWHSLIRGRRLVIVLDNAINESQVRSVLPPEGPAVVLVTSRRVLGGLEGVRRLRLDPLPAEDAVRLLAAILDDPATAPDGLHRIAELCVNVPLALRIAGNRLVSRPGWTTEDLIARLTAQERRLDALAAGDLEIKAAFTLSYQQLSGVARRLFRRLALVPGATTGIELAAVLVQEPPAATEDALDELVDLSLLQQAPDGRLQFHDLLRLYAALELDREEGAADRAAAISRRDTWLLDTAVAAGRFFEPGHDPPAPEVIAPARLTSQATAAAWLRAESDNWLAALMPAPDDRVVEVAEALHWFSDSWPHWPHWEDVYGQSARAAEKLGDDRLQAVHLGYLAWVNIACIGDPAEGLRCAQRALEHARRAGDAGQVGWANFYLSWATDFVGTKEDSLRYIRAAAEGFRAAGDREGLPNALAQEASVLAELGRPQEATAVLEQAVAVLSDPATAPADHIALFTLVSVHSFLADIAIRAERWPEALRQVSSSLAAADRLGYASRRLPQLARRALIHAKLGDWTASRADLETVKTMRKAVGSDTVLGTARVLQERIALVEGLLADHAATKSSR